MKLNDSNFKIGSRCSICLSSIGMQVSTVPYRSRSLSGLAESESKG